MQIRSKREIEELRYSVRDPITKRLPGESITRKCMSYRDTAYLRRRINPRDPTNYKIPVNGVKNVAMEKMIKWPNVIPS